ncbi:MAG: type II toxin-antitoxin system Phd/YefM family antitoxin [Candidatus Marinimicrobia bacterium]|nr:type II toxin-antitoxin system Phd/YefM family antitoxin [Candidatus Neomarinimicrobiota bacterium]MCH7762979.1 type II toxin-antitoxin system Phd/YefM family antitoxin [Candidatus Neomarinimicrobiota bacterium]
MKATVVDLRYKMKDVLDALDNNEEVTILYHGQVKGTIIPNSGNSNLEISAHPIFGMYSDNELSVLDELETLRGGRFNAV